LRLRDPPVRLPWPWGWRCGLTVVWGARWWRPACGAGAACAWCPPVFSGLQASAFLLGAGGCLFRRSSCIGRLGFQVPASLFVAINRLDGVLGRVCARHSRGGQGFALPDGCRKILHIL
jgi:hypothetical protein